MENYKIQLLDIEQSEAFFQLIDANRKRLEDFFAGTVKHTTTLKNTLIYCQEIENKIKAKTYFPYVIIDIKEKSLVGLIDVKNIDWSIPKAELGAFIDAEYEGHGIITKSINYVIDELVRKHHFKKLYCRVANRNKRSIKVVLNAGFELEGILRCDYKTTNGEIVDLNYYGKLF